MYSVRHSTPEDYEMLCRWWVGHGWPEVPQAILPPLGLVVAEDNLAVAAGYIYLAAGVGICWLEYIVTCPAVSGKTSVGSLKVLVDAARTMAVSFDYGVMMTTASQKSLIRLLEKTGFVKTDEGVTHLMMLTGLPPPPAPAP